MINFTDFILPAIVTIIIIFGAIKGINVFDTFLDGAKSGFNTILGITPPLIALIVAVFISMLCIGKNNVQNFQVIQSPTGKIRVQADGGYYFKFFDSVWSYPKVNSVFF
jgi:spore maturation protein SpmB